MVRTNVMPYVVMNVWRASLACESPQVAAAGFAALRSFAVYDSCRKAVLGEGEGAEGENCDLEMVPTLCSRLLSQLLQREHIITALSCLADCDHSPLSATALLVSIWVSSQSQRCNTTAAASRK